MNDVTVSQNKEDSRFEAFSGGALLGYIDYTVNGKVVDLPHTLVFPEFEGQGVASRLTRQSLDMIRKMDDELRVTPTCPYISNWFEKHPEYQDMLAENAKQQ